MSGSTLLLLLNQQLLHRKRTALPLTVVVNPPTRQYDIKGTLIVGSNTTYQATFVLDYLKPIMYDYDVCLVRWYRIEGSCSPTPSSTSTPGSNASSVPGCDPSDLNGCPRSFVTNVAACSVEEACRKFKARGNGGKISKIQLLPRSISKATNAKLFAGTDETCMMDVTPPLETCSDCCEFLVDEIIDMIIGVDFTGTAGTGFVAHGELISGGQTKYRYNIPTPVAGNLIIGGKFGIISSTYTNPVQGELQLEGAFGRASSAWNAVAAGSLTLGSRTTYGASHHVFPADGSLTVSGSMGQILALDYNVAPVLTLSGNFSIVIHGMVIEPIQGNLQLGGNFNYTSSHYSSPISGSLIIGGGLGVVSPAFTYRASGSLSITHILGLHYSANATGTLTLSGAAGMRFGPHFAGAGTLILGGRFRATSPSYTYTVGGNLTLSGSFASQGSDLGTIDMDSGTDVEGGDIGVQFAVTPAPAVDTSALQTVAQACCETDFAAVLNLRHNLYRMPQFIHFLQRNNFTLPGQDTTNPLDVIQMRYSNRTGGWIGNLHYAGKSARANGNESWNIVFEFACTTDVALTHLNESMWKFGMNITSRDPFGDLFTSRLLIVFPASSICPDPTVFNILEIGYNLQTQVATPTASSSVFHDDDRLLAVLAASSEPTLHFEIVSPRGLPFRKLFNYSWDEQLKASVALP